MMYYSIIVRAEMKIVDGRKSRKSAVWRRRPHFRVTRVTDMRDRQTKNHRALLISALLSVQPIATTLHAEDTNAIVLPAVTVGADTFNAVELIKQLQKRIDELEQKVNALESGKATNLVGGDAKAKQHIDELDQKVKVLERERELDQETQEAKAKEAPKISIGENGFSMASAKGDFALQLKGVLQVDSRTFFDDAGIVGNDGLLLRRARPILQGTVYRDFDFLFVPDFAPSSGTTIFDAYANYRYSPALQFQAGKFKVPIGLEQLAADKDILFNERSLVTSLVPNRDVGFELHGDPFDGRLSYAAGIFNGTSDGANSGNVDFAEDRAFAGRLFFQPFKKSSTEALQGVGFGFAGSYELMSATNTAGLPSTTGGSLPGYFTDGQQQFFAYKPAGGAVVVAQDNHWRISPQAYYYYGPFGLLGEYAISDQNVKRTGVAPFSSAHLQNMAWEVSAGWVLTGEDAAFAGGVIPRHSFNPAHGEWGAWQLVARYAQLNIDSDAFPLFADPSISASSASAWSVGLNWYLNRNVMVKASFSHTTFSGGGGAGTSAPATVTQKPENVLFTRIQLAF
jgi:phosphate-selective porin OprO and OprP